MLESLGIISDLETIIKATGDALKLQRIMQRNKAQGQKLASLIKKVCEIASSYETAKRKSPPQIKANDAAQKYLESMSTANRECEVLTSLEESDRRRAFLLEMIQDTAFEALLKIRRQSW